MPLAEVEDECGQLWVVLFGVEDFGVVVDGVVVDGVVVAGAELVVVGFVGVELCVAAIAAPPPAVRANTADASNTVRMGLRIRISVS